MVIATAPEAPQAVLVSAPSCPAGPPASALPQRSLLAFDGRDVSDQAGSCDVRGFALFSCACCGTPRDARFPYCCEFSFEALPRDVGAAS